MRITLLDAIDDATLRDRVVAALAEHGWDGPVHRLHHQRLSPCVGCFRCWVVHPGQCRARDAGNTLLEDMVGSHAVLWLTRPRFGAWDPVAKGMLDKSIGLVSPFFQQVEGETHHRARYRHSPRLVALAIPHEDSLPADRARFETLVARNGLNLHDRASTVHWLEDAADPLPERLFTDLQSPMEQPFPVVDPPEARHTVPVPPRDRPRRALLLVGSAKPAGTSTSEGIGRLLLDQLAQHGWETDHRPIAASVHPRRGPVDGFLEAVAAADLLILATPVYVDAVPSLVLHALHALADAGLEDPPALLPVVQCGFPEVAHTTLAVEILHRAAQAAGMPWAGHLARGAGGAIGADPAAHPGQNGPILDAVDRAVELLDEGQAIPEPVIARFAEPTISPAAYRFLGNMGWLAQAWKHGALFDLWKAPHPPPDPTGGPAAPGR